MKVGWDAEMRHKHLDRKGKLELVDSGKELEPFSSLGSGSQTGAPFGAVKNSLRNATNWIEPAPYGYGIRP